MDFAGRQYAHNWRMDPIVRSLLDDDFYKFLMGQLIFEKHPKVQVAFGLNNRTKDVRLADIIAVEELREQLDHVRTLRFQKDELIWLRGQTFYGVQGIFSPGFIHELELLQLPEYELSVDKETGQFRFETQADWIKSTWWEIHAMQIVNELRYRAIMRNFSRSELDIMYARAKVKLDAKLRRLADVDGITVSDFGTRRRHGHLWQEHCILTANEILGNKFVGTSNAFFAKKHGLESRGTNAHELPMVYAALAETDEDLRNSPYKVLKDWQNAYGDNLRISLPDTFGTTQFLENAPDWVGWWKGSRPDSKEPVQAGTELVNWWRKRGEDPMKKLIIFADGLDVDSGLTEFDTNLGNTPKPFKLMGSNMIGVHRAFRSVTNPTFGWGTTFTNDFMGCVPGRSDLMRPISLVCKVKSANGRPAIKLSDNYAKATGPAEEIERYRRVFGSAGMENAPAIV